MINIQTQLPVREHLKLHIEPIRPEKDKDYTRLDRIIFGDNQFFGINHMSNEKAQSMAARFKDSESIIRVIDIAYNAGIHAFMFNTHDRVKEVCDHFRAYPEKYSNLSLYPSMPYAHKYANAVNENGMLGALNEFIFSGRSTKQAINTIIQGGKSLIKRDMIEVMKLLVDAEIIEFVRHIEMTYGVEAAFNTMNMPALVDFLLDCGIENPIVCSGINKKGFLMTPSQREYEQALVEKPFRALAMSILASGDIPPNEAIEYVCKLPNIRSIVFGASTKEHIIDTRNMIYSYWGETEDIT